jgi:hypothetical protein
VKLILDADVAPSVVKNAFAIFARAAVTDRPLNDLEALGWLVLAHNMGEVIAATQPQPKAQP